MSALRRKVPPCLAASTACSPLSAHAHFLCSELAQPRFMGCCFSKEEDDREYGPLLRGEIVPARDDESVVTLGGDEESGVRRRASVDRSTVTLESAVDGNIKERVLNIKEIGIEEEKASQRRRENERANRVAKENEERERKAESERLENERKQKERERIEKERREEIERKRKEEEDARKEKERLEMEARLIWDQEEKQRKDREERERREHEERERQEKARVEREANERLVRIQREEEERKKKEEEGRKKKEEEERKRKEEEERKRKEEEERRKKEAEEKVKKEKEERERKEKEEEERRRVEEEKVKKEKEELERKEREVNERTERERLEREERERKERAEKERLEKERKEKEEQQRREQEERERKEREEQERIVREETARKAREEQEKQEREALRLEAEEKRKEEGEKERRLREEEERKRWEEEKQRVREEEEHQKEKERIKKDQEAKTSSPSRFFTIHFPDDTKKVIVFNDEAVLSDILRPLCTARALNFSEHEVRADGAAVKNTEITLGELDVESIHLVPKESSTSVSQSPSLSQRAEFHRNDSVSLPSAIIGITKRTIDVTSEEAAAAFFAQRGKHGSVSLPSGVTKRTIDLTNEEAAMAFFEAERQRQEEEKEKKKVKLFGGSKKDKEKEKEKEETKIKKKEEKEKKKKEKEGLISPRPAQPVQVKTVLNEKVINAAADFFEPNLDVEGIFRLSGSASNVERIFQTFLDPETLVIDSEEDPHDVTGALKKYLRNLETPLVPASLYHELISFNGTVDEMKALISRLPAVTISTFQRILRLLVLAAENNEVNKMDVSNLAIVFGPTLLRPAPELETPDVIRENSELAHVVLAFMINNFTALFD